MQRVARPIVLSLPLEPVEQRSDQHPTGRPERSDRARSPRRSRSPVPDRPRGRASILSGMAAKASLISQRSTSPLLHPAPSQRRASPAGPGAVNMMTGSAPQVAVARTFARGLQPVILNVALRGDQHCRGPIHDARGVARGVDVVEALDVGVALRTAGGATRLTGRHVAGPQVPNEGFELQRFVEESGPEDTSSALEHRASRSSSRTGTMLR